MNSNTPEYDAPVDEELADRLEGATGPSRAPDCPPGTDLFNYAMKVAPAPVAERVAAHLATGCGHCRSRADAMMLYLGTVPVTARTVPPEAAAAFRKPNPIVPAPPATPRPVPGPVPATQTADAGVLLADRVGAAPPVPAPTPPKGRPAEPAPGANGRPRRPVLTPRRAVALTAGFALAASVLALAFLLPRDGSSSDSVTASSRAHLSNATTTNTNSGGDEFILRRDQPQPVTFRAAHPNPLKYQGLLHIAYTAKLVASAGKNEQLVYPLKHLDSDWRGADSRYEFLVIVTANRVLPGWPEQVIDPLELKDLFTAGELSELQTCARKADLNERNEGLKRVLRTALDRRFGANRCWFEVSVYLSENQR